MGISGGMVDGWIRDPGWWCPWRCRSLTVCKVGEGVDKLGDVASHDIILLAEAITQVRKTTMALCRTELSTHFAALVGGLQTPSSAWASPEKTRLWWPIVYSVPLRGRVLYKSGDSCKSTLVARIGRWCVVSEGRFPVGGQKGDSRCCSKFNNSV